LNHSSLNGTGIYPLPIKVQDFNPIEEAFEQHHFIVAVTYNETAFISSQCLELKLLKHSETCILNDRRVPCHANHLKNGLGNRTKKETM